MPYSSMLFHANLESLAARRENLSRRFPVILWILPPVFTASFLHPDPLLSPVGSDLLKSFSESILVPSAVFLSYNMVLTTTSTSALLPLSLFHYLSYYSCSVWSHICACRPIRSFCSCVSCFMFKKCFHVLCRPADCVVVFYEWHHTLLFHWLIVYIDLFSCIAASLFDKLTY